MLLAMGMLSIGEDEDLLDPRAWKKEKQPVILSSDREKGFYGPGHNSFVKLPDGTDVCTFIMQERMPRLRVIRFTIEPAVVFAIRK